MLQHLFAYLSTFLVREEEGQDLAEYAILLGLIAIIVLVAVGLLGGALNDLFSEFAVNVGAWF